LSDILNQIGGLLSSFLFLIVTIGARKRGVYKDTANKVFGKV